MSFFQGQQPQPPLDTGSHIQKNKKIIYNTNIQDPNDKFSVGNFPKSIV